METLFHDRDCLLISTFKG